MSKDFWAIVIAGLVIPSLLVFLIASRFGVFSFLILVFPINIIFLIIHFLLTYFSAYFISKRVKIGFIAFVLSLIVLIVGFPLILLTPFAYHPEIH